MVLPPNLKVSGFCAIKKLSPSIYRNVLKQITSPSSASAQTKCQRFFRPKWRYCSIRFTGELPAPGQWKCQPRAAITPVRNLSDSSVHLRSVSLEFRLLSAAALTNSIWHTEGGANVSRSTNCSHNYRKSLQRCLETPGLLTNHHYHQQ